MPRILFMHQVSTVGGASYCMLSLLKGLDKSQFEPVVMLRQDGPLADEIRSLGIQVSFLTGMPTVPYNKSLLEYRSLASYIKLETIQKKFFDKLNELNIDIVYLNNMMLYPYLKTAKKAGCKTIMHVREHWPKDKHQLQMKRAREYALKYADSLIAINHYSASLFPECSDKTTIIYDWIDFSDRYEPRPFDEIFGEDTKDLKVLLFTGGMARIKGTLEIVKMFSEKITGPEYRLLMMGAGLDYQFTGPLGRLKKVLMKTGWKPYGYQVTEIIKRDRRIVCIPPTYKIVDLFKQAYCTVSYFTIPHANLALAESICLCTVSLASRTEEAFEYSGNGKGAVLYAINSKESFINSFRKLEENYSDIKECVREQSKSIAHLFDPNRNIKLLNEVCNKVIEKTR